MGEIPGEIIHLFSETCPYVISTHLLATLIKRKFVAVFQFVIQDKYMGNYGDSCLASHHTIMSCK